MDKISRFVFLIIIPMVFLSSCGYKAKAYIARRDRVDQGIPPDSAYFKDNAKQVSEEPKKSRQVIVVEVTRENKNIEETKSQESMENQKSEMVLDQQMPESQLKTKSQLQSQSSFSNLGENKAEEENEISYTVQKDDTLQKIAKQLLGSYSQWTKIYELNRDKIKDPNFLKPGTILVIPKR